MFITGIAFFIFWLLLDVFTVAINKAALITALIFLLLGAVTEGYPRFIKR